MGPTAFVPGSQYCNTEAGGTANKELALAVPEGSVALVHYDIWHRGTANISNKNRYMVKFLYLRMEEPDSPSWDCENPQPVINKDLWGSIWNWHSGIKTNSEQTAYSNKLVEELIHSSVTDPEPKSLESSYSIGYVGNQAVPHLIDALKTAEYMTHEADHWREKYYNKGPGEALAELLGVKERPVIVID